MNWFKKAQYSPALLQNIEKKKQISISKGFTPQIVEWVADISLRLGNPSYFEWLLRQGKNGSANVETREDDKKIFTSLQRFEELKKSKKLPPEQADINRIKTVPDLLQLVGSFEQKQQGDIKKTISELGDGATLLYSQKNVSVVRVDKYEAGQKLFSTGWCVQNNPDHFDGTYHPPYFMFTLENRPYALYHQDSGQFKNEHDNSMNLSETVPLLDSLRYLVKNNIIQPESSGEHHIIKETFEVGDMVNHACETKDFNNLQSLLKTNKNYANLIDSYYLTPEVIKMIELIFQEAYNDRTISPHFADINHFYDSLPPYLDKNKFPLKGDEKGILLQTVVSNPIRMVELNKFLKTKDFVKRAEEMISLDKESSYVYALYVIGGRFKPGEPEIAQNPHYAYLYAKLIYEKQKERLPEMEKTIAESYSESFYYALDVLHNRFELGEPAMALDDQWAYNYSTSILLPKNIRLPEMEEAISRNAHLSFLYARKIGGRFELGEPKIAESTYRAYDYAAFIFRTLNQRVPIMEQKIASDPVVAFRYAFEVMEGRFELGELAMSRVPSYWGPYKKRFLENNSDKEREQQPQGLRQPAIAHNKNWYKKSQFNSPLESIINKWTSQGVTLYIYEKNNTIILDSLIVSKNMRNRGIGSQIMQELINYADKNNKRIELSPGQKDDYHGTTSKQRLIDFYKRFGLIQNKGRNKDFSTNKTMYREPLVSSKNFNKIAQINNSKDRNFLKPPDRPTIYQGDIEGISHGSKTLFNVPIANEKNIEIRKDNNNSVYALIDGQEVGYAQILDDKNFDISVAQEYQKSGIGTILMREFLKLNPSYRSGEGDFTEGGYRTFQKAQEARVYNEGDPIMRTGEPVTFSYTRSQQKAPDMGSRFAQDIEPKGEYMNYHNTNWGQIEGRDYGTITFNNPLVLEHKTTAHGGWKTDLSNRYNGKTGRALTQAIKNDGYDGIITIKDFKNKGKIVTITQEIVNLNGIKSNKKEKI